MTAPLIFKQHIDNVYKVKKDYLRLDDCTYDVLLWYGNRLWNIEKEYTYETVYLVEYFIGDWASRAPKQYSLYNIPLAHSVIITEQWLPYWEKGVSAYYLYLITKHWRR